MRPCHLPSAGLPSTISTPSPPTVEISNLGSRLYDRDYKRDAYLELGVAEVWLVDVDSRQVFVSRRNGPKDEPHDRMLTWRSPAGRVIEWDIPSLFDA